MISSGLTADSNGELVGGQVCVQLDGTTLTKGSVLATPVYSGNQVNIAGPLYADVNNAVNLRTDSTTISVSDGQVVLGTVPLANVLATLNGAGWTYGGNLALQQLVVGTGTATFLSTATFQYANSSGPCVQIGAAGAVFKDSASSPTYTLTCSSSGISAAKSGVIYFNLGASGLVLTNASLTISGSTFTVNIDTTNAIKVTSGGQVASLIGANLAVMNGGYAGTYSSAFCGIQYSTYSIQMEFLSTTLPVLIVNGQQVVGARQVGPGVPGTFASLVAVSTWCDNLYQALCASTGHGLIN
jgi:hypothetical protein